MPSSTLTLAVSFSTGWTTPANAIGSNNAYASFSVTSVGSNTYLRFSTNAASLITAGAIITGVRIDVEYRVNTTTPQPRLTAGPREFPSYSGMTDISGTTTDTVYTFGGPGNPLGAASIDGVGVCTIRIGNNATGTAIHYIDNVVMYVDWELPKAGNTLFHGENF